MDRHSGRGVSRRRRLETSLSSTLLRAALVAGGAGALFAPVADAQLTCRTTGDTQTCTGAPRGGAWFNSTPEHVYANNLIIRNVTGPIIPSGGMTAMGLARTTNDARDLSVTLDPGIIFRADALNYSGLDTDWVGLGAVFAYDKRTTASAPGATPDVILNTAANITYNSYFVAPTREVFLNKVGEVGDIEGDLAKIDAALALGGKLDSIIENGFSYSDRFFWLGLDLSVLWGGSAPDADAQTVLRANCVVRPGFEGTNSLGKLMTFFGNLCWFVEPPDDPAVFRHEADQYKTLGLDRIDYLRAPPRPEEFLNADSLGKWQGAVYARAEGAGVASGDARITNTGGITTFGDLTAGIVGVSQSTGEVTSTGGVYVSHTGQITTHDDSSGGILALSLGARTGGENVPGNAGVVEVTGTGGILTEGRGSHGILAYSLGGGNTADGGDFPAGNGGDVTVRYGGGILTKELEAVGILAQSKGGWGGSGNNAGVSDSAEAGGLGGDGKTVTVELTAGSIHTMGKGAHAISATSIGGDGGEGGSGNDVRSASRGGAGGNGGNVSVTNRGALITDGRDAYGVIATSFAGAGGLGGDGDSVFRGRGARGGEAGNAGDVSVNNYGGIFTASKGSFGIFAQSVGGIAGNGGGSTGAFSSNAGNGGTRENDRCKKLAIPICGDGGLVTITNSQGGIVSTAGDYAYAIFAQSIGGGGGVGGDAGGWFSVSGGDGGNAGFGKKVAIINSGLLQTTGDRSAAIFAQSIGGGGGSGGDAKGGGQNVSIQIGGDGGAGGNGGDVEVTNTAEANIRTSGQRSDGVFAQSVGGGGGAGGDATAIVVGGFAVPVAIGGDGGIAGDAGEKVKVVNRGRIDVAGDFSNGIFAQSIGGGGGVGGAAYAFGAAISDIVTLSTAVSIGGDGGAAGDGKWVDIDNFGLIVTRDFNANGIVGQSVGGGGGAGGSSTARALSVNAEKGAAVSFSLAIGGDGGAGGDGGLVDISNDGGIFTFGDMSTGVVAQSIGGGGGMGGDASAASETVAGGESSSVKVSISLGGDGGAAGDAGEVKVINRGSITTLGDLANGITGQSVGGGGGIGGAGKQGDVFADLGIPEDPGVSNLIEQDDSKADRNRARDRYKTLQTTAKQNPETDDSVGRKAKAEGKDKADAKKKEGKSISVDVNIGIGGDGGTAGNGRRVDIANTGEIITGGFMSMGVFAQSVGGGGGLGAGGEANGSGQVGLGGGIGGDGGSAGDGGEVLVSNKGDITTMGDLAFGIFAQSVGGGGGAGALGTGEGEEKHNVQLNMGGDGGAGGKGGHVWVDQTGNIVTLGDGAIGIVAQSIGGGGGIAGSADQGSFASISLGGNGGAGGTSLLDPDPKDNAGLVEVYARGKVTTEGDGAHGVLAQSIGGGGGMAVGVQTSTYVHTIDAFGGINIDTGLTIGVGNYSDGGAGGVGGNGGNILGETSGLITTLGKGAYGVMAQSIGGGGGSGGSGGASFPAAIGVAGSTGDAGTAGTITLTHTGSIHALGQDSVGIWAQSVAGGAFTGRGAAIRITLNNGEIIGGSGDSGAGVFVSGGAANEIRNRGGRISALSGNAIIGTDGDDAVFNSGLIKGNIGLGGGANSFANEAGGRFESGKALFVGGTGAISNAGIISPFGDAVAGASQFVGRFTQSASGDLRMNYNPGGVSDRIDVTGSALLAGKLTPVFGHADTLKPNKWTTMLTATGGFGASTLSIDHMDTLVIDWETRVQGNALQAGINKIDFKVDGLASEQSALAGHVQDIWAAGAPAELDAVLDQLAFGKDMGAYKELLSAIHPWSAFSQGQHAMAAGAAHLGALQSCPEGAGWANPLHETGCTWVKQSFTSSQQDGEGNDPGYRDNVARLQGGQQFDLGGWFAGYSVGYEKGSFDIGTDTAGTSEGGFLGGVMKYDSGPWLGSAALDVAYATAERRRKTGFPTVMIAESSNDTVQLSARLRGAYLMQWGDWYVRPALDLDGYHVRTGGFQETGAGAFNMIMADSEETFGAATLSLTGGLTARWGGALWHPFVEGNVTGNSADAFDMSGRLQGAPAGVSDFTVSTALPETLVGGKLGLEAFFPYGSLRAELEQRQGDAGYKSYAGSLKLRFGF